MKDDCTGSGCSGCASSKQCGGCSGCGKGELLLTKGEGQVLLELGQFAFLPILQEGRGEACSYHPIPQDVPSMPENFSQVMLALQQKGLITIDPDLAMPNVSYGSWESKDLHCGSIALTAKGQEVVDWLSPEEVLS
jgi:hypothetical protein